VNPLLAGLANNGGPTRTRALLFGSPAIDAGDTVACPATDQRGVARPDIPATACDIGAFEFSPPPHYFLNSLTAQLPEEAKLPTMSWGTLTLTPASPSKEGTTSCENSSGGFVENPKGGGAGDGQVSVFLSWNCSKPTSCPEAEIEFPPGSGKKVIEEPDIFPGGELGTPEQGVLGESFPWPGLLTEAVAGKIRGETKGVVEILGCQVKKSVEGSGALGDGDGDTPQFVKKLTVCFTNPSLNAKQEPLTENGTQVGGPNTSKVKFDTPGSGHILCKGEKEAGSTEEITVAGVVTGEIKTMTYEGQEVILTH
jgi:hypothetical protein